MRKRRAIIFDDEPVILLVLTNFFETRGYEVLSLRGSVDCPVFGKDKTCGNEAPCGDIMLTDYKMPGMTGIELLQMQARNRCKLAPQNKALLTGYMEPGKEQALRDLGATFFEKPFQFDELERWVIECEQRMDLALPLGYLRKEDRQDLSREIVYTVSSFSDEVCRGTAVNLSPSGLCVKVRSPLEREASVVIKTGLPIASLQARVRWLQDAGDGAYLAGLQCVAPM